jgi:predicted small integral membrane protein
MQNFSTSYLFRFTKTVSILFVGIMACIIVIGNITDYYTNYHFVEHVLKMDTTFPDSKIQYRSIETEWLYHLSYIFIILCESAMAAFCVYGSFIMYKSINDSSAFHANKKFAITGLLIGIVVWFFGFEVIGGEWFAMWQSTVWNGLASAERIVTFLVLVVILLHLKEE